MRTAHSSLTHRIRVSDDTRYLTIGQARERFGCPTCGCGATCVITDSQDRCNSAARLRPAIGFSPTSKPGSASGAVIASFCAVARLRRGGQSCPI